MSDVEGNQHIFGVELPPDSILTGSVVIVSFIGADGVEMWDSRVGTAMSQSQIVGLLEMAKHSFLAVRAEDT
jgi:hypothetical protein